MKKSTNNKFSDKNFNTLNLKDCKEKAFYSNKKQKKISKLLHINLNPKFIDGNSPSNTLYVTKKTNEEIFSSTSYINKINIQNKKIENKISKSLNKFENFIKRRIKNNKLENNKLKLKNNEHQNGNKIRNYLYDSKEFQENNIFFNKLTDSSKAMRNQLMNSKKEINKDGISKNTNKILFTENTFSGDENQNKLNSNINLNEYMKSKKIGTKKELLDYKIKSNLKKNINDNLFSYREYIDKLEENLYKKNSATIVINNNININFGNKFINGYSESKKHGQNSISSLLQKLPTNFKK